MPVPAAPPAAVSHSGGNETPLRTVKHPNGYSQCQSGNPRARCCMHCAYKPPTGSESGADGGGLQPLIGSCSVRSQE